MPKITAKKIGLYAAVSISIALTIVLFVRILELTYSFVKISSGLPAAAAVFSMIALGIIELSAVIVLSNYITRSYERGMFVSRFSLTLSIEVMIFPLVELARLLVFLPMTRGSGASPLSIWNTVSWIQIIGAPICALIGIMIARKYWVSRRKHYLVRRKSSDDGEAPSQDA